MYFEPVDEGICAVDDWLASLRPVEGICAASSSYLYLYMCEHVPPGGRRRGACVDPPRARPEHE